MGNIQLLNKSIENHFPLVFILFFLGAGLLEQGVCGGGGQSPPLREFFLENLPLNKEQFRAWCLKKF